MSQYFSFYLAKKVDGKFKYVAPYIQVDDENIKPASLMTRSRSFINSCNFLDRAFKIDPADMDEVIKSLSTYSLGEGKVHSCAYAISYSNMHDLSKGGGIRSGYVSPEAVSEIKAKGYILSTYDIDDWYIVDPEVMVHSLLREEDKYKNFVFVSYFEADSTAYQANFLCEVVEEYIPFDFEKEDYYFILDTEY